MVRNAGIDYTPTGLFVFFARPDKEYEGIRVLQGEGLVKIKWTEINSVTITRNDKEHDYDLKGVFLLNDGRTVSADIFVSGEKKLFGVTDIGDYSIELGRVRTIAPLQK